MTPIETPIFDCDNHDYEARDAFTRHVPRSMQNCCVRWAEIEGLPNPRDILADVADLSAEARDSFLHLNTRSLTERCPAA
jgi:hypothetical protein